MRQDSGVILVNVLVTLAIGSAITVLMLTSQDNLLQRTTRAAAAVQAEALANGAETSVVVALKRDMSQAPLTDHFMEPWARAAQQTVELSTGQFSIEIEDTQSRFNINNLVTAGVVQPQILARLIRDLGLPDTLAADISLQISRGGPVDDIEEIDALTDGSANLLRPHVVVLPFETAINLNTADVVVLGAVLGNLAAALQLIKTRDRNGFLTREDLASVGALATGGAGFTSQVFDVTSRAQVDTVSVTLQSRILRRSGVGFQEVAVISRRLGD